MGVIYKLRPEIKEFILEQKKTNPKLSCRGFAALVQERFQVKLSKSSINAIIKGAGLSMPVGRREKKEHKPVEKKPEIPIPQEPPKKEEPKKPPLPLPPPVEKEPEIPPPPTPPPPPAPPPVEKKPEIPPPPQEVEVECTGAVFLKAIDYLIGGSRYITTELKKKINSDEEGFLAKTEAFIYMPLFGVPAKTQTKAAAPLCALIDKEIFLEEMLSYLNALQAVKADSSEILSGVLNLLREVRGIKFHLLDGATLCLDSQFHTLWPTPNSPYDFSTTIYNIKGYINRFLYKDAPLVLFMAPSGDLPSEEFFNLLLTFNSQGSSIDRLDISGNKSEALQSISPIEPKKRTVVFGLWPNQFVDYRTIKKVGDFKPFRFNPLKKDLFLAEAEIVLSQPNMKQEVTLRGCVLKEGPAEKPLLVILSNLAEDACAPENIANIYLNHWPNLREALYDFQRKMEAFSYLGDSQRFFSTEILNLEGNSAMDLKAFFKNYLEILDAYFKWHFLGAEFRSRDFPTMKGIFYDLKARLKKQKDRISVTFCPPMGFAFQKDLEYACRRLNEREIEFADGRRLWFNV